MKALRRKKKALFKKHSVTWWKLRRFLINRLGGEINEEVNKKTMQSYNHGKVLGQVEAAFYIKTYMKSLWEDKKWEDKAYKKVSKFLERDLYKQYKDLSKA